MWVKRNSKTVFLDLSDYFLNFGNIEDDCLKEIVLDTKFNEVMKINLPKQMVSNIQDAFSILDREGKGTIGERDIKVTLRALGMEATPKKIKRLIEKLNIKNPDEISREDYEKIMLHVINDIDSEEQMEQSFKLFNIDGSGTISIGELKRIASTLELDLTNEEIQEMIYVADTDKDGVVTKENFIDIARKIF